MKENHVDTGRGGGSRNYMNITIKSDVPVFKDLFIEKDFYWTRRETKVGHEE